MPNFIEEGRSIPQEPLHPAVNALDSLLETPMSRREAIGAITTAIVLATAACSPRPSRETATPPSPKKEPNQTPVTNSSETRSLLTDTEAEKVVYQEVIHRGIFLNDEERVLWQTHSYKYNPDYDKMSPDEQVAETRTRVLGVLTLMFNSKNQYLHQAAFDYAGLLNIKRATIDYGKDKERFQRKTSYMEIGAVLSGQNVNGLIHVSSQEILSSKNDIEIAFQLAHEIEHVRNIIIHQDNLDKNLSPQEKFEAENARSEDINEVVAEEARGYAIEVQAYIVAYGYGYNTSPGSNLQEMAATFIKAGGKRNNPNWLGFIRSHLVATGR